MVLFHCHYIYHFSSLDVSKQKYCSRTSYQKVYILYVIYRQIVYVYSNIIAQNNGYLQSFIPFKNVDF